MCLSFVHSHTHTLNTFKWLAATFHLIVERKHFYECLTRKLYLPSMHFNWQHKTISIVEMSWKWKRNSFKIIHSMNIGMLQKNIQNKLFDIIVTAMFTEYFFTLLLVCNEWWVYGTESNRQAHGSLPHVMQTRYFINDVFCACIQRKCWVDVVHEKQSLTLMSLCTFFSAPLTQGLLAMLPHVSTAYCHRPQTHSHTAHHKTLWTNFVIKYKWCWCNLWLWKYNLF